MARENWKRMVGAVAGLAMAAAVGLAAPASAYAIGGGDTAFDCQTDQEDWETGEMLPKCIAAVGNTPYYTMAEAVAAAKNGGTIRLLSPLDEAVTESVVIPADADITLDLAGKTIVNTAGKHTIVNRGKLVITDSSAKHTGTVDNVSNGKAAIVNYAGASITLDGGNYTRSAEASKLTDPSTGTASANGNSYYVLKNFGTMTIQGSSVVRFSAKNAGYGSSLIANGWYNSSDTDGDAATNKYGIAEATLTIAGGTMTGGRIVVKNDDYGVLDMTGGTIIQPTSQFYALLTYHKATVTGGSITAPLYPLGASGVRNAAGDAGQTTVGGTAAITSTNGYAMRAMDNGTLTVTGGTFTSGNGKGVTERLASSLGTPTVAISGGTFNVAPASGELAEGFEPTRNEDGTFGVTAASNRFDIAPYRAASGYTAPDAPEGQVFAGWYADAALTTPVAADVTSGYAYARFLPVSDVIEFRGGSLRLDYGSDDYAKTSLRFGYRMPKALGLTSSAVKWTYEIAGKTYGADAKNPYDDGTYIVNNLVFTGVPLASYATDITVTASWTFTTADGTTVTATETAGDTRSVRQVAKAVVADASAGETVKAYAQGLLDAMGA
ncbi:hypothetical protein [Bifidobacterium parmae]|uniref:Cell adhesion protein n=1 Tax=Bifidobacterium parmae TaxID=361854 RepID=A0A2N5J0H8_9BIFI|nr:hypothetical protein [Bifidobacterium parmae]PLS27719.1 cell adhesion protein [Bifidobacterium parmae]